jgi:hypothetical protein
MTNGKWQMAIASKQDNESLNNRGILMRLPWAGDFGNRRLPRDAVISNPNAKIRELVMCGAERVSRTGTRF